MLKRIMLVVGKAESWSWLQEELERAGNFEVILFSPGESDLLTRAREIKPHLVLLEMLLPKASGPEIAGELLNYDDTKWIPVLFLTSALQEKAKSEESPVESTEMKRLLCAIETVTP